MLPFRTVISIDGTQTHLVVVSPAIAGSTPDALPVRTLCHRQVSVPTATAAADVECLTCLNATPRFMHLPAFTCAR